MPTFEPRALIWDMDGLLVDSEPLWHRVERQFARERGGDWTDALAAANVGKGLATTLATMRDLFGIPIDLARDSADLQERFIAGTADLALKPGAKELLDRARGRLPQALASSSPLRLIEAVLARYELAPSFTQVVSGEQVDAPKPAPDVFLLAASRLGVPPGDCVVLEDSLAGVTAARRAGMMVIGVPEHQPVGRDYAQAADAVVSDLFAASSLIFPNASLSVT